MHVRGHVERVYICPGYMPRFGWRRREQVQSALCVLDKKKQCITYFSVQTFSRYSSVPPTRMFTIGATLSFEIPRPARLSSPNSFVAVHSVLITGTQTHSIRIPYYRLFSSNSELINKYTIFCKTYTSPPI